MDSLLLLVWSGLVPAAVAAIVLLLACRLVPTWLQPAGGAAGIALGFAVAYVLLPEWTTIWTAALPKSHWHWLPYLGFVAAASAVSFADDCPRPARWIALGLLGLLTASLLVPTWPAILPHRPVWIALSAAYFTVLGVLLAELPAEQRGSRLLVWLAGSALGTTLIVAIGVSARYGEVSLATAPAILGCLAAILIAIRLGWLSGPANVAAIVRALLPVYLVLAGGAGFIGCIERQPKLLWAAALAPCAPLIVWAVRLIPSKPYPGWRAFAIELIAVLAVVVPLVLWSAWDLLTGDGY
jgi:hypothetical protein